MKCLTVKNGVLTPIISLPCFLITFHSCPCGAALMNYVHVQLNCTRPLREIRNIILVCPSGFNNLFWTSFTTYMCCYCCILSPPFMCQYFIWNILVLQPGFQFICAEYMFHDYIRSSIFPPCQCIDNMCIWYTKTGAPFSFHSITRLLYDHQYFYVYVGKPG